ncbi:unnamed protein product [Oikopleura dioica]|uniref:Uncharacterized protein n=1 Tax=Oikopleura dioica TaxID=34765 RepID=E4Z691_OIKDI|nr:unnamed protein product [Oikopleura dioica]
MFPWSTRLPEASSNSYYNAIIYQGFYLIRYKKKIGNFLELMFILV